MSAEEKYVAAAYLVVFLFVLVYVLIMALKVTRLERELGELAQLIRQQQLGGEESRNREQVTVG